MTTAPGPKIRLVANGCLSDPKWNAAVLKDCKSLDVLNCPVAIGASEPISAKTADAAAMQAKLLSWPAAQDRPLFEAAARAVKAANKSWTLGGCETVSGEPGFLGPERSLCGLDARTGKLLWSRTEFKGNHSSPAIWRKDGKTYAVQNIGLVELQTGKLLWHAGACNDPSPVVSGDLLVANGSCCFRLTPEKPQELWRTSYWTGSSTPIIYQGYLYGIESQSGPLFCVDMATGKTKWMSPEEENYSCGAFNTGSCTVIQVVDQGGADDDGLSFIVAVRAGTAFPCGARTARCVRPGARPSCDARRAAMN